MQIISKIFEFDAAHRLVYHKWKCHNIHWHRYTATITLKWNIWDDGMVKDFADLKWIKDRLDNNRDHTYIYNPDDKYGQQFGIEGLKVYNLWCEPTAENIAKHLYEIIKPKESLLYSIEIRETRTSIATYRRKWLNLSNIF